ncbi:MAG: putative endonuclease [Pseudohongiellaceae bacterium]
MANSLVATEQKPIEQESQASPKSWYLYIIRCKDKSLYTGITLDIQRRYQEHQNSNGLGKGAKFLRGKGPLELVYGCCVPTHSAALKLEYKIKKMGKAKKESMIASPLNDITALLFIDHVEKS